MEALRTPPQAIEAEKAVLGCILLDPRLFYDVSLTIRPADFYDSGNRVVAAAIWRAGEAGGKIDPVLVYADLQKRGENSIVSPREFSAIAQAVPTVANAVHYAEEVREAAAKRRIIDAATAAVQAAYKPDSESQEILQQTMGGLLTIAEGDRRASYEHVATPIAESLARLDRKKSGDASDAIDIGYPAANDLLSLGGSEFIILGARPSMGKTAFATNVAVEVARNRGPVLFISLEMSAVELSDRILAAEAAVNSTDIRKGDVYDTQRSALGSAALELGKNPLYIFDEPNVDVLKITALGHRLKRTAGLAMLVIDYLQLIEPDSRREPREVQVSTISRRLKALGRELKCPILCLAQLNREGQTGAVPPPPRLSNLRESGAIEQDADVVMFLHRESYYTKKPDDNSALLIVEKQRNGATGEVRLIWRKEFTRFDPEPEPDNDFAEWNNDSGDF